MGQLRSMGASLDYRRHRFTMDDAYTRAVMRFFAHLAGKGYIYRGSRIVNWCPGCASVISDLEVDHIEVDDSLFYVRYPFADGSGFITVATVRPATILADVAVAVHPEDERYRHAIGHCNRSRDRVEPLVMLQWWVEMEELVRPAIAALREGRVRCTPEQQTKVMLSYLENIRPWCISRQLWWGHRIPVWYCPDGHTTIAETTPAACSECGSGELVQDEDVLDTWFSSALWPFATLGWPEETPELERFYPGDVCSTGRDINFLWVSRMIWSGIELRGEPPFHSVNYHSMILAPDGRRMSKSLGTGIDPTDLIAEHGADATRYELLKMSSTQDVRFSVGMLEEGRKLANKLWNVARLLLSQTAGVEPALRPRSVEERWILSRLDGTRELLEGAIP